MKRTMMLIFSLLAINMAFAEVNVGVDIFNRYVWRGTDYGNAASIQPSIEYSFAGVTVGAWGAWAVNGSPGANENDLFITKSLGPVKLTVTDYFFPGYAGNDNIFDPDAHILEVSSGINLGPVVTTVAMNISGDDDNSAFVEFAYQALTVGLGNGIYSGDGKFAPVSIGLSGERENISVSYIINPDQETSFLVVGLTF